MALAFTDLGTVTSTSDLTTYDFGNFTAPSDGLLIACIISRGNTSRVGNTVSIGGTSVTPHVTVDGTTRMYIASKVVAAGDHNITLTLSGASGASSSASCTGIFLTGYQSATPTDTGSVSTGSGTSLASNDVNITENGGAVYVHTHTNTGLSAWSAATERDDQALNGTNHTSATYLATAAETPHTETVSWTGAVSARTIGAAWRAAQVLTLSVDTGSFTLTGIVAQGLRLMNVATASFILTGVAATKHFGLTVITGVFALTGVAVTLVRNRTMPVPLARAFKLFVYAVKFPIKFKLTRGLGSPMGDIRETDPPIERVRSTPDTLTEV